MRRLSGARVAVVGLGAVGSYATEALARAGVGSLCLVDFDRVKPSNINRQLLALDSTVGQAKVDLATARVADINPECQVTPLSLFVDEASAPTIIAWRPDVLVDAIDSLACKVGLLVVACEAGVPTVSSMGAAQRLDPLALRVDDIARTTSCPLARFVRRRLRRRGVHEGVRCVYSTETTLRDRAARDDPESGPASTGPESRGRARAVLGSFSCLTGMFGLMAANEAMRLALGDAWPGNVP